MGTRPIVDPIENERGEDTHPAWGLIGASRVTGGAGVLFDSDIRHNASIVVRISTAGRQRDLNHDYIHPQREVIEVQMSEAQWASFVSTMNVGSGVPCTIRHRDGEQMPQMPYEPRLAESMAEVQEAANASLKKVSDAFAAYKEKKNAANLRTLEYAIKNAPPNMVFASTSLTEHAENVVQRARADIEAVVLSKARQLGIDASDIGGTAGLLGSGDDD